MSVVFDTCLLVDYLRGIPQAHAAFEAYPHRSITVITWVEVMAAAPEDLTARTRDFLRGFERLAINEAIADRALSLIQRHEQITMRHALPWATAQSNALVYVTPDFPKLSARDATVLIPYRNTSL
ncbi:MAG: PIN domain-containing protein [Gammaproteobacteria bacterium]